MQFITYEGIRERFRDHLWIDVVSKCDLLPDPLSSLIADDGVSRYKKSGPDGAIRVSVKSEVGISEVCTERHALLYLILQSDIFFSKKSQTRT